MLEVEAGAQVFCSQTGDKSISSSVPASGRGLNNPCLSRAATGGQQTSHLLSLPSPVSRLDRTHVLCPRRILTNTSSSERKPGICFLCKSS